MPPLHGREKLDRFEYSGTLPRLDGLSPLGIDRPYHRLKANTQTDPESMLTEGEVFSYAMNAVITRHPEGVR